MLAIGIAAAAASFTHVHQVAVENGQDDWIGWADAIVLELMSVAAGLDVRRRRRHGHSVAVPVTILIVAVACSLAAQIETAKNTPEGWIAAALPALGFLAMVKIALSQHASNQPGESTGTDPQLGPGPWTAELGGPGPSRAGPGPQLAGPGPRTAGLPGPGPRAALGPGPGPHGDRTSQPGAGSAPGTARTAELDAVFLAAAKEAAKRINASGRQVTRKNLAAEIRRDGHSLSNAAVSHLLRALRNGQAVSGRDTAPSTKEENAS